MNLFSKNLKISKVKVSARFKIFLQKKKRETLKRPLIFVSKGIVRGNALENLLASTRETREVMFRPLAWTGAFVCVCLCNSCKQLFRVT